MLDKEQLQDFIAARVAKELADGDVVNLGIGLPTRVVNYLPEGVEVCLQSENGFIDMGPTPTGDDINPNLTNAGGKFSSILTGGAIFDSAQSFLIIRGGHVHATILGALQVDKEGNLANWMIPGKMVPGMGGAMDLVTGAKKVIVAMEHTAKGEPKIFNKCTLPLTAVHQVNMIVTEMAVFDVTPEGLVLRELNDDYTMEELKAATEADFIVPEHVAPYKK